MKYLANVYSLYTSAHSTIAVQQNGSETEIWQKNLQPILLFSLEVERVSFPAKCFSD